MSTNPVLIKLIIVPRKDNGANICIQYAWTKTNCPTFNFSNLIIYIIVNKHIASVNCITHCCNIFNNYIEYCTNTFDS